MLLLLAACTTSNSLTLDTDVALAFEAPTEAEAEADVLALLDGNRLVEGIDAFSVEKVRVDAQGFSHVRLQQHEGDIKVFGGEAIVHLNPDGTLSSITDDFHRDLDVVLVPTLPDAFATDLVLEEIQGKGRVEATVELSVFRGEYTDHLVYLTSVLDLEGKDGPTAPTKLIDAHTGEVVLAFDNIKTYALSDSAKVTWDAKQSSRLNRAAVGDSSDGDLLTSHDAVQSTLDYLTTNFQRNSFDNAGGVMNSYGHYKRNHVNAYWDGSAILIGDGDGSLSNYLGTLDIVAHEFGHAVTDYEGNMVYSGQPGALNEASSDILAATIEAYVDGGVNADTWDLGEDCWLDSNGTLRQMDQPSVDGDVDHYSNLYTGTSDNGGVHWNSGIANHYFYLLSVGGQHHNASLRSGNTVTAIGIDDAYAIWYKALSDYMTTSTDFDGARTATENACTNLGYGTTTCDAVSYAWYEVGVGSDPGGTTPPDTGDTAPVDTDTGTVDTGTPATCPAGYTAQTGTLATGATDQYSYSTTTSGSHEFTLSAGAGTDFDLYLYKANKKGRYGAKATSTGTTSSESISYAGTQGDYRIDVKSYSGSGDYTLCYLLPN